ncbi:uncharacterized protein B0I36DRAFT_239059 [Microdochium trichocladiopsis]|uniref:Postreplication repair E3 ubiquitin-protein ligase RAD18 n=1 Tax=Microdochium trichocladiopsis TaxID=1682393 RepID=A0A9P8YF09_9PEZI|nr:uncharacterized protein B0I36DRAFT_239059 [Microdochium trichocladiopsis]KAH7035793.1 hypothetical protein B0I36DRAFT_239059 [Microdochium trichocladiopsis]
MDGDEHDIADSTDWINTPLAGLVAVEAALRCQVCKDFYDTPMLTSCNHTFCSVCIRRALSNEGKCPLCRAPEQELKLRSNWATQEAVQAFTAARPALIKVARQPPGQIPVDGSASPKRQLEHDDEADDGRRSSKRLRSSARASKSRAMESTAEMARQEIDLTCEPENSPEPNDGLVACPVCNQRMKEAQVYQHLDQCIVESQRKPTRDVASATSLPPNGHSTTKPPPTLERLPAINYSMLKEAALRKKLQELGIDARGSKAVLEKRHKEWMTLWNANCDSLQPKRKAELLRELEKWERTQGADAPTSSRAANQGAQIRAKDFDGTAWAVKHDASFQDLIAQARRSRQKTEVPAKESSEESQVLEETAQPDEYAASNQTAETSNAQVEIYGQEVSAVPIPTLPATSQSMTSLTQNNYTPYHAHITQLPPFPATHAWEQPLFPQQQFWPSSSPDRSPQVFHMLGAQRHGVPMSPQSQLTIPQLPPHHLDHHDWSPT